MLKRSVPQRSKCGVVIDYDIDGNVVGVDVLHIGRRGHPPFRPFKQAA